MREDKIVFPDGTKIVTLESSQLGHFLVPFLTKHDGARRESNHHRHKHQAEVPHVRQHQQTWIMEDTQKATMVKKHSEPTKAVRFMEEVQGRDQIDIPDQAEQEQSEPLTSTETLLVSNSRERATHRSRIMEEVESRLIEHHVRSAPQRTNVYGENVTGHSFAPGSALYGAYTRRGKSITKATLEEPEIVELFVKLSTCRPPSRLQIPFSSIQHGELWVSSASGHAKLPEELQPIQSRLPASSSRGTWHDIRRKWLVFGGKSWHCSRPYTGQRISIIFYVASAPDHHQKLRDLGFVVPDRPHEEQAWLQAVDLRDESYVAKQDAASPEQTVIVVAERQRQLVDTLHSNGFHVLRTSHAHVKFRRALPPDLAMIKQDIKDMQPQLLWIQYQGQAFPGRRAQTRLLHDHFQALIQQQLQHGHCVVECQVSECFNQHLHDLALQAKLAASSTSTALPQYGKLIATGTTTTSTTSSQRP
eukprot:917433-Amphidinium_carterae.8